MLNRARALGLTARAARQPAWVRTSRCTRRHPRRTQARRTGPRPAHKILRQICAHLPHITSAEMRTGIELAIDTGRRPEEICDLPHDCLARDDDGSPVLVHNNHKADRLGRRLPISEATAILITNQQRRVRARYPNTAIGELKLLPTDQRNPDGSRAITGFSIRAIEASFGAHARVEVSLAPVLVTLEQRILTEPEHLADHRAHLEPGQPAQIHVGELLTLSASDTLTAFLDGYNWGPW